MLQWMGGSRRKVATSRKSTQKRQKQYFEQRRRQQQYQQQTAGLDSYENEMDIPEEPCKEHRSLDVISLVNLSKIDQECRSSCPSGTKDLGIDASKQAFSNPNGSLVIQSGTVVQSADCVQYQEARTSSAFQMETASPKNASDSRTYALNGVNSKPDQRETTAEKPLSVLDLLVDDKLDANMEANTPHEAHVAFSVEGLGRVGTETSVRSPQQHSRAFPYGLSSLMKGSGQLNLSKKFNSLLDGLETEVDATMQDINFPLDIDHLDFSSDHMDLLSSPRQKSFTFREGQHDGHMSKKNRYFDLRYEDKCDDMSPLQYDSLFDERGPDISWKTRQSRMDDSHSPADNLTCRAYDPPEFSPEFSFEDPRIPIRAAEKVTNKFDVLGSTSPFSKHAIPENNCDFLVSNWSRHPTAERKFDHIHITNQPQHFTAVPEDARENSSLHSEESCSSTAVRHQASDDSLSNGTSRHCMRRQHAISFAGSRDKYSIKAFAKDTKHDGRPGNISTPSATDTKILNSSDLKPQQLLSPLFKENLETEDNWFFEERHTIVDINPGSSPFSRNSETKRTHFNSDQWDEDPFSEFPAPKSQFGTNHELNGFHSEFPSPMVSKPEVPPDSSFQTEPKDFSFTAGYQGDTLSPDISPQESISKDFECNAKLKPSSYEPFDLGEEIFIRNENLVATDASNSLSNDHEGKESKDQTLSQRLERAFLPDLVEETSPFIDTTNREKEPVSPGNGDHHASYEFSHPYQNGKKERTDDFGMGYEKKSGYVDSPRQAMVLQSYVLQLFCVQKRLKY